MPRGIAKKKLVDCNKEKLANSRESAESKSQ